MGIFRRRAKVVDPGGHPDWEVRPQWREVVNYWEGEHGVRLEGAWGVTPNIVFVPDAATWDAVMPPWLRGRRDVVCERLTISGNEVQASPQSYPQPVLLRDGRRWILLAALHRLDLRALDTWFVDPQVHGVLGGPDELRRELAARDEQRGPNTRRSFTLVASDDSDHAAGAVVVEMTGDASAALRVAVDPARRREGYGRLTLRAATADRLLAGVGEFTLAVGPEDAAGAALARSAGFVPDDQPGRPDGPVLYRLHRDPG